MLIVTGSALCSTSAVAACMPGEHFPPGAPLWIVLSTATWTWVLLRGLRRFGLIHAIWLGPVLGMLNSGTACMFAFAHESASLWDVGRMFLLGVLVGSLVGSFLGLVYGTVIALVLRRLQQWERSDALDASLRLFASASLVFAGIATLHIALEGAASRGTWRIPPEVSLLVANGLAAWALFGHARVALWLRTSDERYATIDGVLTFQDRGRGPFREGQHALGLVGTPLSYAVRAGLLATLLGTELTLWLL